MRLTSWLSLGTLLCSGCGVLSNLQRSSDDITVQAEHIADAIQGGQVAVQVGIHDAIRLAEGRIPGIMSSLNGLAQTAAIAAGNQLRCSTDLVKARVAASIRNLFNRQATHDPMVCGSDPIVLATADVLTQERRYVTFGGFDLPQTLTAWVVDANGQRLAEVSQNLVWNSPYAEVLVMQEPTVRAVTHPGAAKIVLMHGPTVMSEVGIANAPPMCEDIPNKEVRSVTIELRPTAATHGDNDFGGHGPLVTWGVTLQTDPTGRLLQAKVSFKALERGPPIDSNMVERSRAAALSAARGGARREPSDPAPINQRHDALLARVRAAGGRLYEPAGDDTDTLLEKVFTLWVAPQGFGIVAIQSPTQLGDTYYDTNHDIDTFHPGAPIASIDVVGDTDGPDIGRSGIKINFDVLTLHIRQLTGCTPAPGHN